MGEKNHKVKIQGWSHGAQWAVHLYLCPIDDRAGQLSRKPLSDLGEHLVVLGTDQIIFAVIGIQKVAQPPESFICLVDRRDRAGAKVWDRVLICWETWWEGAVRSDVLLRGVVQDGCALEQRVGSIRGRVARQGSQRVRIDATVWRCE